VDHEQLARALLNNITALRGEVHELRDATEDLGEVARDGQRALKVAQSNAVCLDETKAEIEEIRRAMNEHEDRAAFVTEYGTEIVRMAREDNARRWLAKTALKAAQWVTAMGVAIAMVYNLIVHHQSVYETFKEIAEKAVK